MHHLTLNTGHMRVSPRSEVRDDVIQSMLWLLPPGEHDLAHFGNQFASYRLVVPETPAGYVATLYHGTSPLLTIGVAGTQEAADDIWTGLESLYLQVTDLPVMRAADFAAPHRPESLPWCAVVLVLPHLCPDFSGDFERCLAWTYLEDR